MSNQEKAFRFASRYRMQLVTIGALVGFFIIYGFVRRSKSFPDWDDKRDAKRVVDVQPSSEAPIPTEDNSKRALYDPDDPAVDPKYRLPAQLSTNELHQLMLDTECLVELAEAHDRLFGDYAKLYALITDAQIKEALYSRIKNRQGFKQPQLPVRWHEFSEAGIFSSLELLRSEIVAARVERMRYRIIGGKYSAGDIRFVSFSLGYFETDIPKLVGWVSKAKQLRKWLVDDAVLTADSQVELTADTYPSGEDLIAAIKKRHVDGPPRSYEAPPLARVAVNPDFWSNGDSNNRSSEALAQARRRAIARLTEADHSKLQLTLDRLGRYLTKDVRFVATPEELAARMARAENRGDTPEMDSEAIARSLYVPLLHDALTKYTRRKLAFRVINDALRQVATDGALENAADVIKAHEEMLRIKSAYSSEQDDLAVKFLRSALERNAPGSHFTVGDVEDADKTARWLDQCLESFEAQHVRMDVLLKQLRENKSSRVRDLVILAAAETPHGATGRPDRGMYVRDPFSRDPARVFVSTNTEKLIPIRVGEMPFPDPSGLPPEE